MTVVAFLAVAAAALNLGFLAGRVFERWEWVAREKRQVTFRDYGKGYDR